MMPSKRTRNLFNPSSRTPYRLSRFRLENFINCPRCFYLDRRLGIEPPPIPGYTLNSAVDQLLKNEFDGYRRRKMPHPIMTRAGFDGIPWAHPLLDRWRDAFKGVEYHHAPTNFVIFGAVDDLWITRENKICVVDYKSTSTSQPITLDSPYRQAYKRQMEIYQWLLRKQGLDVSDTGYFVYCNGDKNRMSFDSRLEFAIEVIPFKGKDDWIEPTIIAAHQCLLKEQLPDCPEKCFYCHYRKVANHIEGNGYGPIGQQREVQGELF